MSITRCPNCGHEFRPGFDPEWGMMMRQKRQEAGLTLRDVSEYVGYTQVHLSDIERGNRARPANSVKLGRWYEVLGIAEGEKVPA